MRHALLALGLACLLLADCVGELEPGSVSPAGIPDPITVARTGRPNDWLICRSGTCKAEPSEAAQIYPVPADALWAAWRTVLAEQPDVTVIAADASRRLIMVQDRTPVFRFVDTITIRVLPLEQGASTFAAYSRSEIGHADAGTNRHRLRAWVAVLEQRLDSR
ncbi:DUF1499 domain-containing protein [Benzoatithermus flavus]|uniref:DUF1499 domain-containing protein n=1 Tax=Benzoatithermus flavus TaxID=3108223 RepID=A0ABU8XPF6_9PROT